MTYLSFALEIVVVVVAAAAAAAGVVVKWRHSCHLLLPTNAQ